jgi:hypothetical protein
VLCTRAASRRPSVSLSISHGDDPETVALRSSLAAFPLFFGSDVGGDTAAVLSTFTQTCQALSIEPWRYLRDVLERLPSHPPERLAQLVPDEWAQAQRSVTAAMLSEPTGVVVPPASG